MDEKGFFWPTRNKKAPPPRHLQDDSGGLKGALRGKPPCAVCGLLKGCSSPKMKYTGRGKKGILIVAEAPGAEEDAKGIQLVGKAGQFLRKELKALGVSLDRDCWKTNAIKCRPPGNKTPSKLQVACCRRRVLQEIEELKPKKIILLGKVAVDSVIGSRPIDIKGMETWAGTHIPDQEFKTWLFPTYHPSYVLRMNSSEKLFDKSVVNKLFKDHLKQAIEWKEPFRNFDVVPIENLITTITKVEEAKAFLKMLIKIPTKFFSFDTENTGLKPDRKGHKIRTISFCREGKFGIAFPIFYDDKDFLMLLKKVLTDPKIKKAVTNMKYENRWVKKILGYKVKGWYWDTMLAAHVINNATGVTGLKYQGYINFGIAGYGDSMKPYLEGCLPGEDEKSDNRFNRVMEAPLEELLKYNAMDSILTHRLVSLQKTEIKERKLNYKLLHETSGTFAEVERNGICIDEGYYKKASKKLQEEVKKLRKGIYKTKEAVLWKKKTGNELNINSSPQLATLFYKHMELTPSKKTKKGNVSVDDSVLEGLSDEVSFIPLMLRARKLETLDNTFIKGIVREAVDGVVRPNNNLHLVRTYRTSNDHPNFQNQPKRVEESMKIIRSGIIPRKGNILLGVDYGKLEVCVSVCYHKDKNMLKYLRDPTTDMHRDVSMELFLLRECQLDKAGKIRYGGKNGFVFPEFYGDWYESCAEFLWGYIKPLKTSEGVNLRKHLKEQGIGSYDAFKNHVRKVEKNFWDVRFQEYSRWKKKFYADYVKNGFLRQKTGFECSGVMEKNDTLNYPIQGPACHCLLWSLNYLQKHYFNKKKGFETRIIGQIHDEGAFDLPPRELEIVLPIIRDVMCNKIIEAFPWIIVPLDVEADVSEVDGNWGERKTVKI